MRGREGLVVVGGLLNGRAVDVHMNTEEITAVTAPSPRSRPSTSVVDVAGATLLPGLHDHHVHLRAWAAARASVHAGPPAIVDAYGLAAALRSAPEAPGGWIRAVGYHQSVAGNLDRLGLDRLVKERPVRLQHRSGALWVLNGAALRAVGLAGDRHEIAEPAGAITEIPDGVERDGAGRPTGRLWRADGWLRGRLPALPSGQDEHLGAISRVAAARGVTGFTDATPDRDDIEMQALAEITDRGLIGQRLHLMAPLGAAAFDAASHEAHPAVTVGPVKVLLDDDQLPSIEDLAAGIRAAHLGERAVAVHCVTRVQSVVALAAFEAAGTVGGDRIEHGALLASEQLSQIRRLGMTVVTQPGFVAARGDSYLTDVESSDQPDLWRLRSLLRAGVRTAAGTDAPLGPWDPWCGVSASLSRRTVSGAVLGGHEAIGRRAAIGLWSGLAAAPWIARRLSPGQPPDLCALQGSNRDGAAPTDVMLTVARGVVLHRADS